MKRFGILIVGFLLMFSSQLVAQTAAVMMPVGKLVAPELTEDELQLTATSDIQTILSLVYGSSDHQKLFNHIPSGYPLADQISVTSHFGARKHPVHRVMKFHRGTDLEGKTGDLVVAAGEGKVIQTGFDTALGNFVKVQHKYGFESIYGHLSAITVKRGQVVKKGDKVGKVGATGVVTGPHLHYTIKKNGDYLDPFEFIYLSIVD